MKAELKRNDDRIELILILENNTEQVAIDAFMNRFAGDARSEAIKAAVNILYEPFEENRQ